MTKHDYEAALQELNSTGMEHWKAVHHALLVAAKLQEEPSREVIEEMIIAERNGFGSMNKIFKAMMLQLLKELET